MSGLDTIHETVELKLDCACWNLKSSCLGLCLNHKPGNQHFLRRLLLHSYCQLASPTNEPLIVATQSDQLPYPLQSKIFCNRKKAMALCITAVLQDGALSITVLKPGFDP